MGFFSTILSILLAGFLLAPIPSLTAQDNPFADSLLQILPASTDTQRVHILNDLGWEFMFEQPEVARKYLLESRRLSRQLNFPKGEAQSCSNRGVVETIHENYDSARTYYLQALEIRERIDDRKGVAKLYNNLGNLESDLENYEAAIGYLRQSIIIQEELGDSLRMARSAYNLAIAFDNQGAYTEALENALLHLSVSEYMEDDFEIGNAHNLLGNIKTELNRYEEAEQHYLQAFELKKQLDDPRELAVILNSIGNSKDDFGEQELDEDNLEDALVLFKSSLDYYLQALEIYRELDDSSDMALIFNNLGLIHKRLGDYYEEVELHASKDSMLTISLNYFEQALHIHQIADNEGEMMNVYNGIADVKRRQKDYQTSLDYTKKYLKIAKTQNSLKYMMRGYKDLARAYSDLEDYKKAYKYRKKYDDVKDEIFKAENLAINANREALYSDLKERHEKNKELNAQRAAIREAQLQRRALVIGLLALVLIAGLLYNRYRTKNRINRELQNKNALIKAAQDRSDELLRNILPAATAEELKTTGAAKARQYASVTVLFTDFKSFTHIAEQLAPEALVAQLHHCFSAFDQIARQHGVEKIKTIGDAYMCVGGLPEPNESHATDVVRVAQAILAFMDRYNADCQAQGLPIFQTRIGIHTGPVVAGIVGQQKFAYDIWGDTVNLAARMESSGDIGKINISAATYDLVQHEFDCVYRGKINAKNKGELDMYFVERKSVENTNEEAADTKERSFS